MDAIQLITRVAQLISVHGNKEMAVSTEDEYLNATSFNVETIVADTERFIIVAKQG